jgi:exodeoxyribonuclease V beta subunit
MTTAAKPFDDHVYTCDIAGWNLVEASAGTGKTYQIQTLYLRLVLEQALSVDRILVVTFTEAATEELRSRLQSILGKAAALLARGTALAADDPDRERIERVAEGAVQQLTADGMTADSARRQCAARASIACSEFDRAAVFTIHGFCARLLQECAFQCGLDFDSEMSGDTRALVDEVVHDIYRQQVLPLDHGMRQLMGSPQLADLQGLVGTLLAKPDAIVLPEQIGVDGVLGGPASEIAAITDDERAAASAWISDASALGLLADGGKRVVQAWTELTATEPSLPAIAFFADARHKDAILRPPVRLPADVRAFADACTALIEQWQQATGRAGMPQLNDSLLATAAVEPGVSAVLDRVLAAGSGAAPTLQKLFADDWLQVVFTAKKSSELSQIREDVLAVLATGGAGGVARRLGKFARCSRASLESGLRRRRQQELEPAAPMETAAATCRAAAARFRVAFRRSFFDACLARLQTLKSARNVMSYDDLLQFVRAPLVDPQRAGGLLAAVQEHYAVAVIDEFQDTDPVQFEIFCEAFHRQQLPVFVVGDPKQAIYGFRSGDLHTYFRARTLAGDARTFSLLRNWRSTGEMVAGVNELFAEPVLAPPAPAVQRSFATDAIRFTPGEAARSESSALPALEIMAVDTGRPFSKDRATPWVADEVARRIAADIADGTAPADIAVLVQMHSQARAVKAALAAAGVPAVVQSAGCVFDSDEARDLRLLMAATIAPTNLAAVRRALITPLCPADARSLAGADARGIDPAAVAAVPAFCAAHQAWGRGAFAAAGSQLIHDLGIRRHLLAHRQGERRLTNLLHLIELIDCAVRDQRLGMRAALCWFERQISNGAIGDDDAYEIRLESDAHAVAIMTVFKSKGLEFPYVYAPFMWSRSATAKPRQAVLQYHAVPATGSAHNRLVLDLRGDLAAAGDPGSAPALALHQDELLGEQLRMLYVAVTRAIRRTTLVCGNIGKDQRHALHYLLTQSQAPQAPIVSSLPRTFTAEALAKWQPADGSEPAAVCVDPVKSAPIDPPPATAGAAVGAATADLAGPRRLPRRVTRNWHMLSFSALSDHGAHQAVYTEADARDWDAESGRPPPDGAGAAEVDLFAFPGGTRTGNCWHAIFEHLDFTAGADVQRTAVAKWMARYRLDVAPTPDAGAARVALICRMVEAALAVPLPGCADCLRQLAPAACLPEMAFHFPAAARGVSRARIGQALQACEEWQPHSAIARVVDAWASDADADAPLQGFMTGFIDLVFRDSTGRYFLLDWKSNRLGGAVDSFTTDGLATEMAEARYFLQYLLYTVALDRYLESVVAGYDYDTHFGGCYYLFLRGLLSDDAVSVYADRPARSVVQALRQELAAWEAVS